MQKKIKRVFLAINLINSLPLRHEGSKWIARKARKWISSRATSVQFIVPSGCLQKHFSIQNLHAVLVSAIRALCPEHRFSLHDSFHLPSGHNILLLFVTHTDISTCHRTDLVCPVHHKTLDRGEWQRHSPVARPQVKRRPTATRWKGS